MTQDPATQAGNLPASLPGQGVPQKKPKPPAYATFQPNQRFPMNGFWFKVAGYTQDWKVILECVGRTGKKA